MCECVCVCAFIGLASTWSAVYDERLPSCAQGPVFLMNLTSSLRGVQGD